MEWVKQANLRQSRWNNFFSSNSANHLSPFSSLFLFFFSPFHPPPSCLPGLSFPLVAKQQGKQFFFGFCQHVPEAGRERGGGHSGSSVQAASRRGLQLTGLTSPLWRPSVDGCGTGDDFQRTWDKTQAQKTWINIKMKLPPPPRMCRAEKIIWPELHLTSGEAARSRSTGEMASFLRQQRWLTCHNLAPPSPPLLTLFPPLPLLYH